MFQRKKIAKQTKSRLQIQLMNYRIRWDNENIIDKKSWLKWNRKKKRGDCRTEGQMRSLQNKKTLLLWQLPSCELSLACMFTHPHTEETNTHKQLLHMSWNPTLPGNTPILQILLPSVIHPLSNRLTSRILSTLPALCLVPSKRFLGLLFMRNS